MIAAILESWFNMGGTRWDAADLKDLPKAARAQITKQLKAQGIGEPTKSKRVSKYHSNGTWVDGIYFPSFKEAEKYEHLEIMLKAGEIAGYCRQPRFLLTKGADGNRAEEYVADYIVFNNDGTFKVIDTKGFETQVFKIKLKRFRERFNIRLSVE